MGASSFIPPLFPRGTFTGVPSHFRGWCATASEGGSTGGFRGVGRQFGKGLLEYVPNDLEHEEWLTLVDRMDKKYFLKQEMSPSNFRLVSIDRDGLADWLRRHFPRMMQLVPRKRYDAFLDGFIESYQEDEMLVDFPADFESVEVNLDDPCNGVGYVHANYFHPHHRRVTYSCPAPSCRDVSRAAVEKYAKDRGLLTTEVGESLAAVEDLDSPVGSSATTVSE